MFIKIGLRKNLLYPFFSIIYFFTREIDSLILSRVLDFNNSLILTFIMFASELLSGIYLYILHLQLLKKVNKRNTKIEKYKGIKLIQGPDYMKPRDKTYLIYILLFMATFFDFNSFIIKTQYLPKYKDNSRNKSLDIRLRGFLPVISAFLCKYSLKLPIFRHQLFALVVIMSSLFLVIISEFIIMGNSGDNNSEIFYFILCIFIYHFFDSFLEITEKYLFEHDFIYQHKILISEGIYGLSLTFIYSFMDESWREILNYNQKNYKFILLIICLIIFLILSGGRNIYRLETNKLYSPMSRSLSDTFLDPLLVLYYYLFENDFIIGEDNKQYFIYFFLNLIISLSVTLCVCIYNELFVLYFCNLHLDTYYEISKRASVNEDYYEIQDKNDTFY